MLMIAFNILRLGVFKEFVLILRSSALMHGKWLHFTTSR